MAVSRMRKIQILAHKSAKEEIVSALREGGVLHITGPSVELAHDPDEEARRESERDLQSRLNKLEHLRDFLKPYVPKEKKSLQAMFNPRVEISPDELRETLAGFDLDGRYDRIVELEGDIRSAEAEIGRKEALAGELMNWEGLGVPVEELDGTRLTGIALVTLEASDVPDLTADLSEATPYSDVMEVSRSGSSVNAAVVYARESEQLIVPVLKRHNARWASFAGATGTPGRAVAALTEESEELRRHIDELKAQAGELASENRTILVVLDESAEAVAKKAAEERFGTTRETFLIEGWMRARDEKHVREILEAIAPEVEMMSRKPEEGEDVPIDLRNTGVVTPFEFVTTLYGRPAYWERDPTPLLAPFFILFFGLCISDAGYGLTLAVISLFFMSKMPEGGGRQLMKLLLMGGLSTTAVGAVMGGWFGIDPAIIPGWLRSAIVLNPLEEPMKMLNIVFVLGILQVMTGLVVKMIADFKDRRWVDGVLDQLVWVFFLALLVPLGYSFILGGSVPTGVMSFAGRGALVAGALVVVTGARKNPNPILKVLGGVLKLYDVVGYFGDVLSYARLLALGLATGAIAMAINGVAEMAGGIPLIGPVFAIVVLIGGHLFNIAVNCLGGFVHSARLQYLEFFSKFFTGGGRAFTPFQVEKRYSVVRRDREKAPV